MADTTRMTATKPCRPHRDNTVTLTDDECVELELVLEREIAKAEKRLAHYEAEGDNANGVARECCFEGLTYCRTALAKIEATRTKGRVPLWPVTEDTA